MLLRYSYLTGVFGVVAAHQIVSFKKYIGISTRRGTNSIPLAKIVLSEHPCCLWVLGSLAAFGPVRGCVLIRPQLSSSGRVTLISTCLSHSTFDVSE